MISKERLEELVRQGATIYEVKYKNINNINLCKRKPRWLCKNCATFEPNITDKYLHHKYYKNLFETREEAEWQLEFGNILRLEKLLLPTWKEFDYHGEFNFVDAKGYEWDFYSPDKSRISLVSGYDHYEFEYSKENYIKACRLAKKLFLGESYE